MTSWFDEDMAAWLGRRGAAHTRSGGSRGRMVAFLVGRDVDVSSHSALVPNRLYSPVHHESP